MCLMVLIKRCFFVGGFLFVVCGGEVEISTHGIMKKEIGFPIVFPRDHP